MSNLHEQLPKYGDIQINLTRNVITEPLYGKIALQQQPGAAGSPQLFDVIIDVNLDYYGGRDAAFNEVADLASAVVKNLGRELGSGRLPTSLGSRANPYMT